MDIYEYYQNTNEDSRLSLDRAHQLEHITTMHYLKKCIKPNSHILDACAGTGAYCFDLADLGHIVTASDLIPENIEIIKQKNEQHHVLKEIFTANILDLSNLKDHSFDVVLCLGAFYHLHAAEDRIKALKECKRLVKEDGIIVIAYLNRFASFLNNFTYHPDEFLEILEQFKIGNKNVFYRTTPQEVESITNSLGIKTLHQIGTDGVSYLYPNQLQSLPQIEYEKYIAYHLSTCEEKTILGYSLHGLFIGQSKKV